GRAGHRTVEGAKDEGRARLKLEVHLRLAVRPRAQLREADPFADRVHDRHRGGGHRQGHPAVQGGGPGVADEVMTTSLLSPANEAHSRMIHHTLAVNARGVEPPLTGR